MNPHERRQAGILYRHFLSRLVDLESLSARSEMSALWSQIVALLAAFSFVLVVLKMEQLWVSRLSAAQELIAAWGDQEFLIATTITVTGLFTVLTWNALFPDRRDAFVLGPLPLCTRTITLSKLAALVTALGVAVIAVNSFTSLAAPFLLPASAGPFGPVRAFAAYGITITAAACFVFSALVALQALALQFLPYHLFLSISTYLQLGVLALLLAVYFLTPPLATPEGLTAPENQTLLAWLPSFWFLGLWQELLGTAPPVFAPLRERAVHHLIVAMTLGAAALTGVYSRQMRRMLEQPDLVLRPRASAVSRVSRFLISRAFRNPLHRSLFLFTARTLARSREHRLLLAFFGSIGLAVGLAYSKGVVYGRSGPWYRPNVALLITGLALLFFSVTGVKGLFALPFALKANWIFQATAVHKPALYWQAIRKSLLFIAAVPVWFGASVLYLSLWPGLPALGHLAVLAIEGILLSELLLYEFRKIPFTCSYLPGKSNLKLRAGSYAFLLFACLEIAGHIELWSLEKGARFGVLFLLLAVWALWAHRRTARDSASAYAQLQFEEEPLAEVQTLDLGPRESRQRSLRYLDVREVEPEPPWGIRLRRALAGVTVLMLVLLVGGWAYEGAGEWRDHKLYTQVGQSFDIGGRSLNLYCAGQGPETVVMDSGGNTPGYGWVLVGRSLSRLTRACWYDRAGYGWSDPAPKQRTSKDIVQDLHKLLQVAHVLPPYILVGHSFGGFNVRVFTAQYPREVAGMVLVDSANEYEDPDHAPPAQQPPLRRWVPTILLRPVLSMISVLAHAGVLRLLDSGPGPPIGKLSRQQNAVLHALRLQPKSLDADLTEALARPKTLRQVQAIRDLGDLPLLVLTAAKGYQRPDPKQSPAHRSFAWQEEVQPRLARLSRRGRQILVTDSGHSIPFEDPDAIVAAVREAIQEGKLKTSVSASN